jgi:hypothetical protein
MRGHATPRAATAYAPFATRSAAAIHSAGSAPPPPRPRAPVAPHRTGVEVDDGTTNELADAQRRLNRSSAGRWELFSAHRERLTDLIIRHLPGPHSRVCVLGAGNCNDLDLTRLGAACAEIHLVDIDGDALGRGLQRQPGTVEPAHVHAGVDITGVWPELVALCQRGPAGADLDPLLARARQAANLPLPGPYDLVVSPAVLTQIIATTAEVAGAAHPALDPLVMAMRAGHVRTMLSLIRPGGRALLVTEIVSNAELPELRDAAEPALPALALRAVMLQNTYQATSPAGIVSWLVQTRPFGAHLVPPGIEGPWRWQLSGTIAYLVVGIVLTRA